MKKRIFISALAVLLAMVFLSGTALAATGSIDSIAPVREYDGRFTDVLLSDWYYSNVEYLFRLGLTEGQTADKFGSGSSMSIAELVTFAARVRSAYYYGDAEYGAGLHTGSGEWYVKYADYLKAEGVIGTELDGRMSGSASRSLTAHILANTLPESELDNINGDAVNKGYLSGKFITDVSGDTYEADIIRLYISGICTGVGDTGDFYPANTITRAEFAAMLTRLVNPALRQTIEWDVTETASGDNRSYGSFVTDDPVFNPEADTLEEVAQNVRWMFKNELSEYSFEVPDDVDLQSLVSLYTSAVCMYPEQGYNAVGASYYTSWSASGYKCVLTVAFGGLYEEERSEALAKALSVHDELWASGKLNSSMTETEIAKVYYNWLCDNCQYDYSFNRSSFYAYGALIDGKAVCQGYTSAYNMFLKIEGIECGTAEGPNHIWTTATLDGTYCHIDVTWGDQGSWIDYSWFKMTSESSMSKHRQQLGNGDYREN